jgi:hypothetical protein
LLYGAANDSITAVGSGFTKGADDTGGDWAEYKVLTGGAGGSQTVNFAGSSGAWILLMSTFVGTTSGGGGFTPLFRKTLSLFGSHVGGRTAQQS